MTDLLTKVTYTRVHGRFIVSEGLNNDPDADPDDVIPQSGSITFTPLTDAVQFGTATPPVTVTMRPVVCQLDDEGYLIDSEGKRGVWLVATNDTDSIPSVWGYKVREDFAGVKTPRIYTISVPVGSDIDLAIASPPAAELPGPIANNDHGDVSGSLTVGPGGHEMDLTGDVDVTVSGTGDVTLFVHGEGTVTVAGEEFVLTGDPDPAVILVVTSPRGDRYAFMAGGSGEPVVPDATPPSAVTDLSATGGEGELTYDWTDSTDAESPVKYGVKVWEDSDAEPGSYTVRTTGGPVTVTGLPAGIYNIKLYAFSNGGSTTPDTATATVTGVEVHDFLDNFDGTAGTLLTAHTPDVGGGLWTKLGGAGTLELDGAGNAIIDNSNGSFTEYVQSGITFTDGSISVDFTAGTGEPGWCIRNNGSGTRILVSQQGNALGLFPFVAGGLGSYLIKDAGLTVGLEVRVFLEVAGTTATVKVMRRSDGKWYNTDTSTWVTPETTLITLAVTSSSGSPGFMFAQAGADGIVHSRFTADAA